LHSPQIVVTTSGWLSIGFSYGQDVYDAALTKEPSTYDNACNGVYIGAEWWRGLKRNQLYRFLTLSIGDIVVVPLWYGLFSICEVIGKLLKIVDFDLTLLGSDRGKLNIKENHLHDGDKEVDTAFD